MPGPHAKRLRDLWERLRASGMSDPLTAAEQIAVLLVMRVTRRSTSAWMTYMANPRSFESSQEQFPAWPPNEPPLDEMLLGVRFAFPSTEALRAALDVVDHVGPERKDAVAFLDEVFDELVYSGRRDAVQNPVELNDLMVRLAGVRPNDIVGDPACGVGALLAAAYRQGRADRLHGYDIEERLVRLAGVALALRGADRFTVETRNSLRAGHGWPQCDVVLTSPPFAQIKDPNSDPELGESGGRAELLFIERARMMLKENGCAVVVVPQSVLFGGSAQQRRARQRLVEQAKVEMVISLAETPFTPRLRTSAAILVFRNAGRTQRVLFHELTGDAALAPTTLDAARVELRSPWDVHEGPSGESWFASYGMIKESGYELTPGRHRPQPIEIEVLPDPQTVLDEIRALHHEIDAQLDGLASLLKP